LFHTSLRNFTYDWLILPTPLADPCGVPTCPRKPSLNILHSDRVSLFDDPKNDPVIGSEQKSFIEAPNLNINSN